MTTLEHVLLPPLEQQVEEGKAFMSVVLLLGRDIVLKRPMVLFCVPPSHFHLPPALCFFIYSLGAFDSGY